jgi:Ca2+-binding EF-hand superfamily protein
MSISAISFNTNSVSPAAMSRTHKTHAKTMDLSDLAAQIVKKADKNGDSKLSTEESGLSSKQLSSLDTNGDGTITTDELLSALKSRQTNMTKSGSEMPPPPPSGPPPSSSDMASSIIQREDTNGDGKIGADETGADSKIFAEIDTDGDGFLSSQELQTNFESRQAEMSKQAGGPDNQKNATQTGEDFKVMLMMLSQSQASSAYSAQNSILSALQSSTGSTNVTA